MRNQWLASDLRNQWAKCSNSQEVYNGQKLRFLFRKNSNKISSHRSRQLQAKYAVYTDCNRFIILPNKKLNQPTQASCCIPDAGRLASLWYVSLKAVAASKTRHQHEHPKQSPVQEGNWQSNIIKWYSIRQWKKGRHYVVLSLVYKVSDHDVNSASSCSCLHVAVFASLTVCLTKITRWCNTGKASYLCTTMKTSLPDATISCLACSCSSSSDGLLLIWSTASPACSPALSAMLPGFT